MKKTTAKSVIASFLRVSEEEGRDPHGSPFRQDSKKISKEGALDFIKKMYPWVQVTVETMPGGLAYYGEFSAGRRMLGNYSFEKGELWYKIYPGTKVPKR